MTNNELKDIIKRIGFNDNESSVNEMYAIYRYTPDTKYLGSPCCNCVISKEKDKINVEFYCYSIIDNCINEVAKETWTYPNMIQINSVKFENNIKEMLEYTISIQRDFYRHTIAMQEKINVKSRRINPEL